MLPLLSPPLSCAFSAPARPWMDTTAPPATRAAKLVEAMNLTEKLSLFHGSCGGYTGNVCGNDRLGIPQIKMNDGPQGFRGDAGKSTAWPCSLAIAATFDPAASLAWGKGMGDEFYRKGANVQLGPGICLARVPRNGRNFEYISGEDPYLGFTMSQPAIEGIQGQGVVANAKHYVDNNQETDRVSVIEVVDERSQFELYYPPFEGAIAGGVGSIMCSYNKIRRGAQQEAAWSCENDETLQRDLKDTLGFEGWVMSDWGATHSMSIVAGLDQEMPGSRYMGNDAVARALSGGGVTAARVDDGARRVLTPLFAVGAFDTPNNHTTDANVTTEEGVALARQLAAQSIVLLKNDDATLPLAGKGDGNGNGNGGTPLKLALIGKTAVEPVVHGGGSGSVSPSFVPSPLDSIRARLGLPGAPPVPPANCSAPGGTWDVGYDYRNTDGQTSASADSVDGCCALCAARTSPVACTYFSFVGGTCWMKASGDGRTEDASATSGQCRAPQPAPACDAAGTTCVYYDDGTDVGRAAKVAELADVAIVFVATTSSEGADRASLSFDDGADGLVVNVASVAKKTVVAAVAPGAVLTPWRDDVDAITLGFMPGQQYATALADVLFGAVNPSAKLPLTLPKVENETDLAPEMWPGLVNASGQRIAHYTEALHVGYRYYHAHGVAPAFAFGHGLSYTTFSLSGLAISGQTVTCTARNTGGVAGALVAQLYVTFPEEAGEPPKQLKGFKKVTLSPGGGDGGGGAQTISFELRDRDLSIWDVGTRGWKKVSGTFAVAVGQASDDAAALVGSLVV